ncbi:hypothetical protein CFC21_082940 [Triticum aestivum]|uniref:Uncharacterized protein n=2 Tax=Triticum aestivum TaxID=4565 RepID=A0A9R1I7J9_WHEAT|nr:hypothetical protein CFC21_082940 [Triticum aestivum]
MDDLYQVMLWAKLYTSDQKQESYENSQAIENGTYDESGHLNDFGYSEVEMMSGRMFGTGAEYGGFALFLVELLGLMGVLIAPYYTVFHDPCSTGYLVIVHIPESLDVPSRGEWPHQLEEAGSSSAPTPIVAPSPFASTSTFPPLSPRPPVLPPTFLPPPASTATRPPLYPIVPHTRADHPAPRVIRGSSSRVVSRPSTPYEHPPAPQLVQDLLDQVATLQRRCSKLEWVNSEMSTALRDYTRPVPPPPEHTPHTPPGSPATNLAPPSPDGTPDFSVIGVAYSELLALDSRQVSSQPPEYLHVASNVTPSKHTPSEYPLSTISAPESDAAAPSVSLPALTSSLDPDLLLTVSPSPLVRED